MHIAKGGETAYRGAAMLTSRALRRLGLTTGLLLGVLAVAASVVNVVSHPHIHVAPEASYFNQDHDLVAFAATGGGAPLPVPATVELLATPIARAVIAWTGHPVAPVRGLAEPRAPPLA